MRIGRRIAVIGGAALLAAATDRAAAAPVAAPPDWLALGTSWIAALRSQAAKLGGPGLIRSYTVNQGVSATAFDRVHANCAYVYDNAVAGLALLAAGDGAAARQIAEALATAQGSDRFWHDGRLRNAYAAGPMRRPAPLAGWWDDARGAWLEDGYQAGTATGVLAWAILLWTALGAAFRSEAEQAADWIAGNARGSSGFTGGVIGHEPVPQPMTWTSTEHNVDCAAAFRRLRRPDAGFAAAFVSGMWDNGERRYLSGLKPDGGPNRHSALDANIWPGLAGDPHGAALDWVRDRHAIPAGAARGLADGVDFDTDRDGIWLEGTAIAALALRLAGDEAQAARFASTLAANMAPDGMVYACTPERLTTGLSTGLGPDAPDFVYFRRPHLAPTAWAAMAACRFNPLA